MASVTDRWLQLPEIAKLFGLSEESIKRLAKARGFPLRRITPFAMPVSLESELVHWLIKQPLIGPSVRSRKDAKPRQHSVKRRSR